jgi:hypothetical protein
MIDRTWRDASAGTGVLNTPSDHGFVWNDLWLTPASELVVGDTFVKPGMGAAHWTHSNGSVSGEGILSLQVAGIAWTVVARDGDQITIRDHDSVTEQTVNLGDSPVLAVLPELSVGEKRARRRIIGRALTVLAGMDDAQTTNLIGRLTGLSEITTPYSLTGHLKFFRTDNRAHGRGMALVAEQILSLQAVTA